MGAVGLALFSVVAVPLAVAEGTRTGTMIGGIAPSLAVSAVWIVLTTLGVLHARRWAALPLTREGLRAGLEAKRQMDGRRPLAGLIAFFAVWAPLKLAADWSMYSAEPWRAVVGLGGFVLLAAGLWFTFDRYARTLEREISAVG